MSMSEDFVVCRAKVILRLFRSRVSSDNNVFRQLRIKIYYLISVEVASGVKIN